MSYCKKILLVLSGVSIGCMVSFAWADLAPVVDITQSNSQSDDSDSSTTTTDNSGAATTSPMTNGTNTPAGSNDANNSNANPPAQNASPDASADNATAVPVPDTSGMTVEQRVARLEQQMANIVQMNL